MASNVDATASIVAAVSAVGAIAAAFIAAYAVRRTAKDSQKRTDSITAAGLYTQLTADQRLDMDRLRDEVATLIPRVRSLEDYLELLRKRARVHMRWDDELVAEVNKIPGSHLRPAPPLLPEDD